MKINVALVWATATLGSVRHINQNQIETNMNQKTLVEKYSTSRFAHIERRRDAYNEVCIVVNDVTGESHGTCRTMEGAKHILSQLDLKLRLQSR